MTREEYLNWAKRRAIEYIVAGDIRQAFTSFASDLQKHPDLARHPALEMGMMRMMMGDLNHPRDLQTFIEGFH